MDTKWKNTEKFSGVIKNIILWMKKSEVRIAVSVLTMFAGGFLMVTIWNGMRRYNTVTAWQIGLVINLLLGVGSWNAALWQTQQMSRQWQTRDETFYQVWKKVWKKQQAVLVSLLIIGELFAVSMFHRLHRVWYLPNRAVGYVLVGTVCIQFIVVEFAVIQKMHRMLDEHMAAMEEINKKHVEKAVRSEKMKVDLISNVSHDLKTPLTSMVGYIELMKKEELDDVMADYVEVLSGKAQKLKEMIESLFDLAKTSSGNVELKLEHLELNRLVEQVRADMEDQIQKSGKEIVIELTEEPSGFTADSSYMYRICQNLMENALKYSAEYTRIFIRTKSEWKNGKNRIKFEITNTSNYRMNFTKEQIVERFARGDAARTSDGNGLGLAIVSTYTGALGGRFDVNIDCDQFKAVVEFDMDGC